MDYSAAIVFVLVTTYTPGPNNILSTSMGAMHGYRRTLPLLFGIASGFFVVVAVCGTVTTVLSKYLPSVIPALRILGGLYIVWLAVGVYRASTKLLDAGDRVVPLGYWSGASLQFMNPKGILYGLTFYSVFIAAGGGSSVVGLVAPLVLAIVSFSSISVWTLAGQGIHRWMSTPRRARLVGIALGLALLYTAADIAGLMGH